MRFGFPELEVVAVLPSGFLAVVYPVSRLCSRLGYSRLLALLAFVPVANPCQLWYVALAKWPRDTGTAHV